MLPRATLERSPREAARGKQSGRTLEIQRLIGRALRGVADRSRLGDRTLTLDCDVLVADAGTRCASVTGAYVALALACASLAKAGAIGANPLREAVAAVSLGVAGGRILLDLDYSGGLDGRRGPERRRDVERALRRDPGHGRARAVRRGTARAAARGEPQRARRALRGAARRAPRPASPGLARRAGPFRSRRACSGFREEIAQRRGEARRSSRRA